jgi:NAD(P)-dependent dehydrogenase (short-subunit alcohol dehydrogenase family)
MGDLKDIEIGRSRASVLWKSAAAVGVIFAGAKLLAKPKLVSLWGKVVLITGSRGLGLAAAQELGRQGARIALCARDAHELDRACEILRRERIEAAPFTADITEESAIPLLVERVIQHFGRIDILINNAGSITIGPLDSFTRSDFDYAMNLMFWAAVNLSFAVLPYMRARRSGLIVNITSIGGRVSVPHLLPYSCAKFALVGFSTGLATEVRSDGVDVLTVIPGLMRTGSYLKVAFKGHAPREFAWFALSGNLPGLSVSAEYAAKSIRRAIERRRYSCTISLPAKMAIACDALLPNTTRAVLERVNRWVLPPASESSKMHEGFELNRRFGKVFQALTAAGRNAARDLNE